MKMAQGKVAVAVAHGDGIGPEIMEATLHLLKEAGARLDFQPVQVGEAVYKAGHTSGIAPHAWDIIRATKVLLKAPITTPQGGGYKSLNVTLRKSLGLYANVRPSVAYAPFVKTRHPEMNVVIVRENEEDLYAGIEHRQTDEVMQCLKLISRPGCEKIVRYAFEYARREGRRKISCMTKDNIMKLTDGLFHRVFDEISPEYPDIATDHLIVDIGAARLADTPERFDVIVTPNLYGDILSDIAAQLAGSVGLAPSANVGEGGALFEAIHGSAPDIAGKGIANPSGLILASVMLLNHVGQSDVAERLHNAFLATLESGIHTADLHGPDSDAPPVSTSEFARAVAGQLGREPETLTPVRYGASAASPVEAALPLAPRSYPPPAVKTLVGVDVFLHWRGPSPDDLAAGLNQIFSESVRLEMITNRGVKVWPGGLPETFCTDHWRCRFVAKTPDGTLRHSDVVSLLAKVTGIGLDFIKCETLCLFDGKPGYTLGQGQ